MGSGVVFCANYLSCRKRKGFLLLGKGVGKIRKKVYLALLMKHLARETGR